MVDEDKDNLNLDDVIKSHNVALLLPEEELTEIGNKVYDDWVIDKTSRVEWEEKTSHALKLALQVVEKKSFPWENASNVKFPIVTIAALQFQSRAYPSLIPGTSVVKTRIFGDDPMGEKAARAMRISSYMSFQVLEEDDTWEKNMDEVLISLAIVGCAFKKIYFDSTIGHNVSEHILAKDLYIPYFAKSLEKASRLTQMLYMTSNDLWEKVKGGTYLELKSETSVVPNTSGVIERVTQESQGLNPQANDTSAPREILEQHRYLDLDEDGYEEPYIVTIDKETKQVLRIVARYFPSDIKLNKKKEVVCIYPTHYFTKYTFIPSPDGGIYDLGLGVLLGPITESINSILNQLIDSGTLANTAGGFLGRGVKLKSGENSFRPFEWKRVDSTGDDLRKGVFPLPVREPSQVLYQTLSLLIDYSERVGMATDPQVGVSPGQNTPAETSRNTIAEGQRVFNAIFKRAYRALKEEFKKLYKLNSIYLEDTTSYYNMSTGNDAKILRADFNKDGYDIIPAADPNMVTKEQKLMQAQTIKMGAIPGLYNQYQVEKRLLMAMDIEDIESILPDPKGPNALPAPPPDSKVIIESMKVAQKDKELEISIQLKISELMQEAEYLKADIEKKHAETILLMAQAEGIDNNLQVTALQTAVAMQKQKQDGILGALHILKDLSGFKTEKQSMLDQLGPDPKVQVESMKIEAGQ